MVKSHFLRVKILPKPKIFLPEAEWVFRLCAQKYLGTGPILHMSEFFILDSKWKTKLFILTTFPLVHYDIIILFMTSSGGSFLISTFKFLSFENKNGKIPIPS